MNFIKNYEIKKAKIEEPHFEVKFEMDYNDGDYMRDEIDVCEDDDLAWILIAYLTKHGKYWQENELLNSFAEEVDTDLSDILDWFDLMLYTDWDRAHSFTDFKVFYIDEAGLKHKVTIPDIDTIFKTDDELKAALVEAYNQYMKDVE